jgi:hypothetical protein
MRLHDFCPVSDVMIGDASLIDRVFGKDSAIADPAGQLLSTRRNASLLRRAHALLAGSHHYDTVGMQAALQALREEADRLGHEDYLRALVLEDGLIGRAILSE